MKIYNPTNFFKHTYCEFQEADFDFKDTTKSFKSKSGSLYYYTKNGVYRYSNHWGRVANCRWKLAGAKNYKNQQFYVGYANWTDFYSLTATEKMFFLTVDFDIKKVKINVIDAQNNQSFLFSMARAIQRKKEIQNVFTNDKWLRYIDGNSVELQQKLINQLCSSNTSLQELKRQLQFSIKK